MNPRSPSSCHSGGSADFLSPASRALSASGLVGGASVLGAVKALLLHLRGHAEHAEGLEGEEQDSGHDAGPGGDGKHTEALDSKLLSSGGAAREKAVVPLGGKKASSDDSPGSAEEVDWGSAQRIVDLQGEQKLAGEGVHDASDDSKDKGGPGLGDVAAGGDADQSSQNSVQDGRQVSLLSHEDLAGQGGDATGSGGHGSGDGALGGESHVSPSAGRAAVESVPAKPEDEGTEALENGGVAWDVHGLSVSSELSDARSEEVGSHEGSSSSSHVNNTASSKVKEAGPNVTVGEPAFGAPGPVHHDGVDEGGDEEGVRGISAQGAALCDGTTDDRRSGGSEGPLEEPESVVGRAVWLVQGGEEVLSADELVGGVALHAKGKAVPAGPPQDCANAGVQAVLDEDVLHVLGANAAGLQEGEARLHEEDEAPSEEEPEAVRRGGVLLQQASCGSFNHGECCYCLRDKDGTFFCFVFECCAPLGLALSPCHRLGPCFMYKYLVVLADLKTTTEPL